MEVAQIRAEDALECYMDWFPSLKFKNYIFKHFVKTVEPTSLKFCTIIELITLHLEYTIAQVKYANFSYAHAQTFVLLKGEIATVCTDFRKLKFWLWLLWTVFYQNQTSFERSIRLNCIKRPTKKFSFTLISINWTKYNIFQKSGYFVTISKTTIRLMHQNYQFLFGKVLPNSVLCIKKSHTCALEYGHNICIFLQIYPLLFTFAPFSQGNSVT